jgi:hypothetical protein
VSLLRGKPTRNDLRNRLSRAAIGETLGPITSTSHFHDKPMFNLSRFSTNCSYGRNAVKGVVFHVFQIDPVTRRERCSDDESGSYPWIGYHLSSIRRGVCLALESWINPCGMPV